MKNNNWINSLIFSLVLLFTIAPITNAVTIIETTEEDKYDTIENNSIVIGVTKFEAGEILTAGKVVEATYNYMKLNGDNEEVEIPKIYYYLEDTWYEIDEENNSNVIDDVEKLEKLDIYFVNNEEKILEIPVKYIVNDGNKLVFETDYAEKDSEIEYEDETIYVPATVNEVKVFLKKSGSNKKVEIETWTKKAPNSAKFISSGSDELATLEKLQVMYEFKYYDSLELAFESIKSDDVESLLPDDENIVAGVYTDEEGVKNLVLLKDTTITESLNLDCDVNLNLGGNELKSTVNPTLCINANVKIDGMLDGSSIITNDTTGEAATAISVESGNCEINGGFYSSTTKNAGTSSEQAATLIAKSNATLEINDAIISAVDTDSGSIVGIYTEADTTLEVVNTKITVEIEGESLENIGVCSHGDATLTECTVIAKADYTANAAGTNYASNSRGVYCEGELELNDCTVWGAHSGVTAKGDTIINGGTYEGYGHGGFYFGGPSINVNIYDATINWAEMKDGFVADSVAGTNGAGMYIGGASNMKVYIDNCDIYGTLYGVVLRDSGGESSNSVYVSNTEFTGYSRYAFRIGNKNWENTETLRAYLGIGNTYDGTGTISNSTSRYEETNESYAKE